MAEDCREKHTDTDIVLVELQTYQQAGYDESLLQVESVVAKPKYDSLWKGGGWDTTNYDVWQWQGGGRLKAPDVIVKFEKEAHKKG